MIAFTLFMPGAVNDSSGASEGWGAAGRKGMTSALILRSLVKGRRFVKGTRPYGLGFAGVPVLAAAVMSHDSNAPAPDPILAGFRSSIDNIDAALIHMLAERFRITKAVGVYKAEHDLPASDPGREERQITRLRKLAEDAALDPEFSEKFLRFIIEEVIRHHEQAKAER
jgi:chorismate mutase